MSFMQLDQLSPTTRRVLRAVAGLVVAVPAAIGTLVLFWVGSIEFSGCFFECGEPNRVRGALYLGAAALTTGLTLVALAWAAGLVGRRRLLMTFSSGLVVVSLYALFLLTSG